MSNQSAKTYVIPVQTQQLPLYVTVKRAAELLDCCVSSITKMIRDKHLPASYLRGTTAVRIKTADLLAVMSVEAYDPLNHKNPKKAVGSRQ
jgi:excisionase family DNA binding protein